MMRCRACGFGQPEALPSYSNYFDHMYEALNWPADWMETEFRSQQRDLVIQTILDGLDRRIGTGDRTLLDVGAYLGRFIQAAAQRGMQAEGLELNPTTAAFAERTTGLPIRRVSVHQVAIEGRRYGAVTMTDVLEHIPRPLAVLEKLHGLLKPGGWIAVKVPHGHAQFVKERVRAWIRPGYRGSVAGNLVHVNQFGVRSLRLALERAGFVDISVEIAAPDLRPNAEPWLRRAAGNTAILGVWRLGRMIPGGVHSPLGLHLQAFARRA
jgi:SAM-dependent methyltransferase